jgi:hypothetical protein
MINVAPKKNGRDRMTGMLHCHDDCFIEVLEGGRQEVSQAHHRKAADPRQANVDSLLDVLQDLAVELA